VQSTLRQICIQTSRGARVYTQKGVRVRETYVCVRQRVRSLARLEAMISFFPPNHESCLVGAGAEVFAYDSFQRETQPDRGDTTVFTALQSCCVKAGATLGEIHCERVVCADVSLRQCRAIAKLLGAVC
ncbi:unnamed protein product, partial [Ectocarpus sp. 12 AP-2014]